MTDKKKRGPGNPNFHKGMQSLNPAGRPVGSGKTGLKRSRLRTIESKLLALNPESFAVIEKSLKTEAVDKEAVATAKWILQNTVVVNKAALAEEITINGLSAKGKEDMEDAQSEESGARFTMEFISDEEVPYTLDNLPEKGTLQ